MTNGNGAPPEAAPPPQLNVLAQYTKDLSFENPNAPASLAPQQQQPAINIQINVSANNIAENEFEVTLSVEGKAENAGKVMFSFDLAYAGVFRILNVPQENLHPLVMIECPRLLFPFAREIIATAVRDGGFPPLMLDPVDFVGLYRQNLERQAAAQAAQAKAELTAHFVERVRSTAQKIVPDRLVAQRGDKGPMGRAVFIGDPRRERHLADPPRHFAVPAGARIAGLRRQNQLRLPGPDQVDIDLGQAVRRRARRRAWCGGNCRSHSASRDRRAGSTPPDACAAPAAACRPAGRAQSAGRLMRSSSALMKPISNDALWITSGASAMNSRNSSTTWANSGLSARNSLERPCTAKASAGM